MKSKRKWCGWCGSPTPDPYSYCSASCASKDAADKLAAQMGVYGIPGRGTKR